MTIGDIFGLGLAIEIASWDLSRGDDHAAGLTELARLEALIAQYGAPTKGSSSLHAESSDVGWVMHSITVDSAGRITVRTGVISSATCEPDTEHRLETSAATVTVFLFSPPSTVLSARSRALNYLTQTFVYQ